MFGSVLAYTAYTWLLQHASVSRVSTYAYVNPLVALLLGTLLLNEAIDWPIVLGAAMIVLSVGLVISTRGGAGRRARLPTGAAEASPAASEEVDSRRECEPSRP